MYRAHIQHDRIKPAVATHTAWRATKDHVVEDIRFASAGYALDWYRGRLRGLLFFEGKVHGTVTIEQREAGE